MNAPAPQSCLSLTKTMVYLTLLTVLVIPGIASAQYLLDTFQDDTPTTFPNGPEIGSATYAGSSATHAVVNWGGGDYRLRSGDYPAGGGLSISYIPLFSANIMQLDYQMRIEGNSNLAAANAFIQSLNFSTASSGISVLLYWGNDLELRIRTYSPFHGIDKTVDLDYEWKFDIDYQVSVFIDLNSDGYWVHIPDMGIMYKYVTLDVDATKLNSFSFSTNQATTGSQVIDDVVIRRGYYDAPNIWYVDDSARGANNGQSWTDAFIYLQDALTVARPGDQIWVAEGAYKPDRGVGYTLYDRTASFVLKDEIPVYGGFNGTETILDERDWLANETILDGDLGVQGSFSDNSFHIVYSNNNNHTAVLDGFTITEANADGSPSNHETFGGGILIWTGSPTLGNNKFLKNRAVHGAGLALLQSGQPFLFNCNFESNFASVAGGAIEVQNGGITLNSCMFVANSALLGGGAINSHNNNNPSVYTNCVFSANNTGGNGGAIYHSAASASGYFPVEVINCSFNQNHADGLGGGIYNIKLNASVNSCILWDNTDSSGSGETAQIYPGSIPPVKYNCIMGYSGAWNTPANVGNIADGPLFVDPDGLDDILGTLDDNLRLQLISPCIDTGDPNPAMNDSDGSRNDMGAYGGPGADLGGIGVIPGSGFLFTDVGNIPRSEITMVDTDPDRLIGAANVMGSGLGIPTYINTAFGRTLWLHGLFGAANMADVDYYQVLVGEWDGATPPNPADPDDWQTLDDKLVKVRWFYNTEWEHEYVKVGPHEINGVPDLYLLTPTPTDDIWSRLTVRIIWNTRNYPNGVYTVSIKAYDESGGTITDITPSLGDVAAGELILRIDNTSVTSIIHSVNYDPANPYYIPAVDGEIQECSIVNLGDKDENLRFFLTASHPHGFLRQFTLDNISGKNLNGGVIAQQVYPGTPPALWNGVTNTEFESQYAPNPPGNLQSWRRCAYQFRLRVWPRITNGFGYLGHTSFEDHYFIDLPGALDCSVYDINNDGTINLIDFAAFAGFYLQSCVIE